MRRPPYSPPGELSHDKPEAKVEHVSLATEDGGLIYADLYGNSDLGVVLAHGGRGPLFPGERIV